MLTNMIKLNVCEYLRVVKNKIERKIPTINIQSGKPSRYKINIRAVNIIAEPKSGCSAIKPIGAIINASVINIDSSFTVFTL